MKYLVVIPAFILISACSTTKGAMDPDYGKAVTAANNAQIVNPAALPGAPKPDPAVQGAAVTRYKNDEVKQPVRQDLDGN